ncbi:MAG: hypothetical protein SGJ24_16585 [Chloroflexota bacterium]|nr:hypothetical protein [Chloroflexota bacterium]
MSQPIVWVHGDCLSPDNPALLAYPDAPAIFVWDDALLASMGIALKRIAFMYECLLEMPVTIRRGDVVEAVARFAVAHGSDRVITVESVSPRFRTICTTLASQVSLEVLPIEPFVEYDGAIDLKRFSRYWRVVRDNALE